MDFEKLSDREKEKILCLYILRVLQESGGQTDRTVIREKIIAFNDDIANFAKKQFVSKKTGNQYSKFAFRFNFAIKNLMISGFLKYAKGNPNVILTQKGINVNVDEMDIEKEVCEVSSEYWKEKSKERKVTEPEQLSEEAEYEDVSIEEKYMETFKENLLQAISEMSPKKFEMFSRLLLKKMGVEFTDIGVNVSNDGGIDGYGYHCDLNDFRTTRVVIQCKRYNMNDVGSPEIDRFLGAMNKFQADYGIFITNSRYTVAAREAARAGTPITFIDGNDIVRLVIKYQLHIKPIQTYELLDFYSSEE